MGMARCRVLARLYGLETVGLRYFNVLGLRQDPTSQYAAMIPKFIEALHRGKRPTIYGDGLWGWHLGQFCTRAPRDH